MGLNNESYDSSRCRLYQFFSVDLIGSTARKNPFGEAPGVQHGSRDEIRKRPSWKNLIGRFFDEFPSKFCHEMGKAHHYFRRPQGASSSWRRPKASRPTFLKALGDELIYYVQVREPESVRCYTKSFLRVLKDTNERVTSGSELDGLLVKGTSWLCGIPVNNQMLDIGKAAIDPVGLIAEDETSSTAKVHIRETFDFVGPSMDCAFRFAKFSDHRFVAVPPDLARVLLDRKFRAGLKFGYKGREPQKGVLGYRALPLVVLDSGFKTHEDRVGGGRLIQGKALNHLLETIKSELLEFRDRAWLIEPYFLTPKPSYPHQFKNIPPWHEVELRQPDYPRTDILKPN